MERPFVSIIVPVRNAQRTIGTTFEYLMRLSYPRENLEMIFADGGSSDDTVKVIKEYQAAHPFIKLVEIPECPSPGFARTQALKSAGGDYIFFTFVISAVIFSAAILSAMATYRWLVYALFAALMILNSAASGGVISYIVGPTDFNLFVVPYLIFSGLTVYGFWMAGWLLEAQHPLARWRNWLSMAR